VANALTTRLSVCQSRHTDTQTLSGRSLAEDRPLIHSHIWLITNGSTQVQSHLAHIGRTINCPPSHTPVTFGAVDAGSAQEISPHTSRPATARPLNPSPQHNRSSDRSSPHTHTPHTRAKKKTAITTLSTGITQKTSPHHSHTQPLVTPLASHQNR
jgi:hypothetical protein